MKQQAKEPSPARMPEVPVDPQFLDRWSRRALSSEPLTTEEINSLFEAARWAPSSYNDQPWLFLYARKEPGLSRFRSLLMPQNRTWADRAPLLVLTLARRHYAHNGQSNRHYMFDTGAAWMSLALQARKLGLFTRAMGAFDEARAYEALGIAPERYEAVCMIAVGRPGEPAQLPPSLAAKETPALRKPLAEVAREWSNPGGE